MHLWPRARRQLPLHHLTALRLTSGSGTLPHADGKSGATRGRQIPRLTQSRARNRTKHGTVRQKRMGRKSMELHAPSQTDSRPQRPAQSRCDIQRRPPVLRQEHQSDATHKPMGQQVHRMRILRSQLRQLRLHPVSASAHCRAT